MDHSKKIRSACQWAVFQKVWLLNIYFLFLFIIVADITFLRCTRARGQKSSHRLEPRRTTPCWKRHETLREIYRSLWPCLEFCRPWYRSVAAAARGSSPAVADRSLRVKQVNAQHTFASSELALTQHSVAATLVLLVHCPYPAHCRHSARWRGWGSGSVHPQGWFSRVCASELLVQGESEMRWYISPFFPPLKKSLARFCTAQSKRPLDDPDLSCNA